MANSSNTPRPWSTEEDNLLRDAVAEHGDEPGIWKTVAQRVPGRTNKACRKRWLHSLSPTIRKTPWTPAEDALLLKLYATHNPPRWSLIAKHIPGRTDDACSKRYREALDPQLKKDGWTVEEDAKLIKLNAQLGSKWTQVGQAMGRSGLGCRNRWRLLERKQRPRNTSRVSPIPTGAFGHLSSHTPTPEGCTASDIGLSESMLFSGTGHLPSETFSDLIPSTSTQTSTLIRRSPCPISTVSSLSGALALASSSTFETLREPSPPSWIDPDLTSVQSPPRSSLQSSHPATQTRDAHMEDSTGHPHSSPSSPSRSQSPPVPLDSPKLTLEDRLTGPSAIVIPSTPPEHSGADPGSDHPQPGKRPSDLPRKRPRLRGPLSTEQTPTEYPRLSSHLPADVDRIVLPYACGHTLCWPGITGNGASRFATASELAEHRRVTHPGNDSTNTSESGKAFRCALQGCGKGWKNINGIQYHLQISKAHFQVALSQSRAPSDDGVTSISRTPNLTQRGTILPSKDEEVNPRADKRKEFHCPREGCTNTYRQRAGLQYHLTHGHLANVAQLAVIPPGLMRKARVGAQLSESGHQEKPDP